MSEFAYRPLALALSQWAQRDDEIAVVESTIDEWHRRGITHEEVVEAIAVASETAGTAAKSRLQHLLETLV